MSFLIVFVLMRSSSADDKSFLKNIFSDFFEPYRSHACPLRLGENFRPNSDFWLFFIKTTRCFAPMTSVSASIHSTMSLTNLVEQLSVIGQGLVGVRAAKPPPGQIWIFRKFQISDRPCKIYLVILFYRMLWEYELETVVIWTDTAKKYQNRFSYPKSHYHRGS